MNKFTSKICNNFANHLYWWIFGLVAFYTGGDILFTYRQFKQLFYIDKNFDVLDMEAIQKDILGIQKIN